MVARHLIYGATGYSGQRLVEQARAAGLRPILGGRDPAAVASLATAMGLPWCAAAVTDPAALDAALDGVGVVLNAAGPFSRTAEAIADACLRNGAHYLDISGEVRVIERLTWRHAGARRAGTMLMPAVGFDVVPTDCLAAHVARRLPGACRLATAVTQPRFLSMGSVATLLEGADVGLMRRDGAMHPLAVGTCQRRFDFGWGPTTCLNVSFADLTTAYHSTGIPNVVTFVEAPPIVQGILATSRMLGWALRWAPWRPLLQQWATLLPADGDAGGARDDVTMRAVAEAEDGAGRRAVARLRTPEAYALTATAAIAILRRVLAGDVEPGFQTPARVYGPDFVLSLPGVEREDVA